MQFREFAFTQPGTLSCEESRDIEWVRLLTVVIIGQVGKICILPDRQALVAGAPNELQAGSDSARAAYLTRCGVK